jgi:hypothetical protein
MRNPNPTPVTCALCGSTHGFDVATCWVRAGMVGHLYALCEACLHTREPAARVGASGEAVFEGRSTLADLEARVERLEAAASRS